MRTTLLAIAALAGAACHAAELFNGKDLSGWTEVRDHSVTGGYTAAEPTWSVVNGAIRTTGTPFGYLRTRRSDFGDFTLTRKYRGAVYTIEVKNPDKVQKGIKKLIVDGKELTGTLIPFVEGKKEYHVTAIMG